MVYTPTEIIISPWSWVTVFTPPVWGVILGSAITVGLFIYTFELNYMSRGLGRSKVRASKLLLLQLGSAITFVAAPRSTLPSSKLAYTQCTTMCLGYRCKLQMTSIRRPGRRNSLHSAGYVNEI